MPPNTPPPPYSRATTITTDRFAQLIGTSPQCVYRRLEDDPETLPVQPIKLGRRYRWPTAKVAAVLGVTAQFVVNGCADDLGALAAAAVPLTVDDEGTPDEAA